MKVARSEVVALFKELGYRTVGKWNRQVLLKKIKSLPKQDTDGIKESVNVLLDLLGALENNEEIKIVKELKMPDVNGKEGYDGDGGNEVDFFDGEDKPPEKKPEKPKKKQGERGPAKRKTVQSVMLKHMLAATEQKPLLPEVIQPILMKAFPKRSIDSMMVHFAGVSYDFRKKGYTVCRAQKPGRGVWIQEEKELE